MTKPDLTLPQVIVATDAHFCKPAYRPRSADPSRDLLRDIARGLLGTRADSDRLPVPRFTITSQFAQVVHGTAAIPVTDVLAALHGTTPPFPQFWLECDEHNMFGHRADFNTRPGLNRQGFLCRLQPDGTLTVHEAMDQSAPFLKSHKVDVSRRYIVQDRVLSILQKHAITATELQLDDTLLDKLEQNLAHIVATKRKPRSVVEALAMHEIDGTYYKLDFLARTLLVLASPRLPSAAWQASLDEATKRREEFFENKRLTNANRLPPLPLTPIEIDVTRLPSSASKAGLKEIRELLGITSVRASTFKNWRGTVIHRRAHERRIPSAVDRTQTPREITARAMAELQLSPDRPTLVVSAGAPQLKAQVR